MVKYNLVDIKNNLTKYIENKNTKKTIIVNVNNTKDYLDIKSFLTQLMNVDIKKMSSYCLSEDSLPDITNLMQDIENKSKKTESIKPIIIFGFSETLELINDMTYYNIFLGYNSKIILIVYQQEMILEDLINRDPRIKERNQVWYVTGYIDSNKNKVIVNTTPKINDNKINNGLKSLIIAMEEKNDDLYFNSQNTSKIKSNNINYINSNFEYMCEMSNEIGYNFSEAEGTNEQWSLLVNKTLKTGNYKNVLSNELGISEYSSKIFRNFKKNSDDILWLKYIYLKLNSRNIPNKYVNLVLENSKNYNEFWRNIINYLVKIDVKEIEKYFNDRQNILSELEFNKLDAIEYIKLLPNDKNKIFYLTNMTEIERKEIITLICRFDYEQRNEILKNKYEDLYYYLDKSLFKLKDENYDDYFNKYIECKLKNKASEDFKTLVCEASLSNTYLQLPYRSYLLEKYFDENTFVYFLDCLNTEFTKYIYNKTVEKLDLDVEISLCKSNFPTTTVFNNEFKSIVDEKHLKINKELDNIIHKDNLKEYEGTPAYLSDELEIINKVLDEIKNYLVSSGYKKVILITDHGSSRLARVENGHTWEPPESEKGKHSGRCCECDENSLSIDVATYDNGHYCLKNYDRFKHGNKIGVELHGGATIEETVIPFMIFTQKSDIVHTIELVGKDFVITNKKVKICIYSKYTLKSPTILFNGESIELIKTDVDDKNYIGYVPVTRAMECTFEVRENGSCVETFTISVKNPALQENSLF